MQIVVGLSLNNLKPRIWDTKSPYYLDHVQAVMVSYADFDKKPAHRRKAIEAGLRAFLGVPDQISIYLDNGSFNFHKRGQEVEMDNYEHFVEKANPNWHVIPQDYIPTPSMSKKEQRLCLEQTMQINNEYQRDGFVPVLHVSRVLDEYVEGFQKNARLKAKPKIAVGGIVPNLLRARKAMPYKKVLDGLQGVRKTFSDKKIHVFGLGGTATVHLAVLLGMDSVDSSGWRNRAARGIVQLPGRGDRMVANLGSWRGRELGEEELRLLKLCECPACRKYGLEGLKANKIFGFCNRATHNLWVLLEETRQVEQQIQAGTYSEWYTEHVENSIYKPLIDYLVEQSGAQNSS